MNIGGYRKIELDFTLLWYLDIILVRWFVNKGLGERLSSKWVILIQIHISILMISFGLLYFLNNI